ncbi:MAG: serine hydrolase domain-containing protein [Clostridia bacterium]
MLKRSFLVIAAFALAACAQLQTAGSGFSQARLDALTARMQSEIDRGQIPGVVMVVMRDGRTAYRQALGFKDAKTRAPMRDDSIFRIYSMTKPIVTVAAMQLVEEGRLQLGDPVSKYLPQLKGMKVGVEKPDASGKPALELVDAQREMTIQDLLRHTSGLTYGFFGRSLVKEEYRKANVDVGVGRAEYLDVVSKLPLHYQPGTTWDYSISTDVLAYVIERVAGKPIEQVLQERIFAPLGMKDSMFSLDAGRLARVAEALDSDPGVKGVENWSNLGDASRRPSGGGGMLSTAGDYARFAQMLVNGGELDGVRILSRKTVQYMDSDHLGTIRGPLFLPGPGYTFGLGGAVRLADGLSATPGSAGEFNWGGYGGTYFWVDPKEKLVGVLMLQAPTPRGFYRNLFRDMVYAAMQ